jgi:MFS family permease
MAPVHLAHGGAGLRVVGVVISVHVAAMYGVSPLFGWLADRIGRLPVLGVGASLLTTAGVLAGLSGPHDAVRLSCGLAALGLGWSAVLVSGSALIVDATPPVDRVRTQGRTDVLMNVSGALGGAAAGITVAASSYAHLGIAAATIAASLLTAVLLTGAASRRTRTG